MRALSLMLMLVATLGACEDEAPDPLSVPFSGLDPSVQPKSPTYVPKPDPTASASASAAAPKPGKRPVNTSKLSRCCAALAALGKRSPDPAQRTSANAAARVCFTKMSEVKQGTITSEVALSQVRSSVLGGAPSACR